MKHLFLLTLITQFCSLTCFAGDSRFRFKHLSGVTGLSCEVSDKNGKRTAVVFSKESDPTSEFILDSLLMKEGVWGLSRAEFDSRGITWDQGIILIGSFASEEKMTESVENGAEQERYREFRLSGIQVEMPFAQWIQSDKSDPVSSAYVVVYHLSLESLFPEGLSIEGRSIDIRSYETKSQSDQGVVAPSASTQEPKPSGDKTSKQNPEECPQ